MRRQDREEGRGIRENEKTEIGERFFLKSMLILLAGFLTGSFLSCAGMNEENAGRESGPFLFGLPRNFTGRAVSSLSAATQKRSAACCTVWESIIINHNRKQSGSKRI